MFHVLGVMCCSDATKFLRPDFVEAYLLVQGLVVRRESFLDFVSRNMEQLRWATESVRGDPFDVFGEYLQTVSALEKRT